MTQDYQKGQILLIVVLVMVTTLTIGLSVAVRSITNIKTSQDAASSEKAFSAAEAGIEKSLSTASGSATTGSFLNNSSYKTSVITVAGTEFPLNNGSPILKDSASDIWLSNYPSYTNQWGGNLTLYWGKSSDVCTHSEATNTMAALEVVVLSGPSTNPVLTRYGFDPCSARSLSNHLQYVPPGGGSVAGQNYRYRQTITIPANRGLFVRVVPLYAPSLIAVQVCPTCAQLPAQGTVVQSVGTADTTKRKIITYRYYPRLPGEILQYSFFIQ